MPHSTLPLAGLSMPKQLLQHPPGNQLSSWRVLAAVALPGLLASCGGWDHDDNCFNCGPPQQQTEISLGVVTADFNNGGFPDVVALSTYSPPSAPNASNLKTYLASAAGVYAAPTLTPDGNNPLYLATADLTGDGLNDVVSASADDGALSVFLNDKLSPGTFNTPLVLASPGVSQLAIADVNGDGLPDLISADFNVSLFAETSTMMVLRISRSPTLSASKC